MGLFDFLRRKDVTITGINGNVVESAGDAISSVRQPQYGTAPFDWYEFIKPNVVGHNFMEFFQNVPEVAWPVDFIASRIAAATFVLKSEKSDAIDYRDKDFKKLTSHPNCVQSWSELVYQFFVYKLVTGNAYMRASMAESFASGEKYKWCDNFWVIPSDMVTIEMKNGGIPLFGVAEIEDLVASYNVSGFSAGTLKIPTWQIWHDRDGIVSYKGRNLLAGTSRLQSKRMPISNLYSVYEARNVIYAKRGAIGFIVNQKNDEAGSVALTPNERDELLNEANNRYGLESGKSPYAFSNNPIKFERTNLSIQDLQPFEETLQDAVAIAAAYGIPSVLVPRKDQATFSNQSSAEKAVYTGVIIPMAKAFCNDLTHWLGYDEHGKYIDVDFSNVDCLQIGLLDSESVKEKVNQRCKMQFESGLITLNDWRAQIGEEEVKDLDIFNKIKFNMSDEELAMLDKYMSASAQADNTNP